LLNATHSRCQVQTPDVRCATPICATQCAQCVGHSLQGYLLQIRWTVCEFTCSRRGNSPSLPQAMQACCLHQTQHRASTLPAGRQTAHQCLVESAAMQYMVCALQVELYECRSYL
jgi:hypothetical protein